MTSMRSVLAKLGEHATARATAYVRRPFVTDYLAKRSLTAVAGSLGFRLVSQAAELGGNEWLSEQFHLARIRLDQPNIVVIQEAKIGRGVRMRRIMPEELGAASSLHWAHRHLFEITGRRSLQAFVAVHELMEVGGREWCLGGIRIRNDFPGRDELLRDVLRVSRTMTDKCVIANVPLGGGQVEVTLNPLAGEKEEALIDLAKALEYLKTVYVGRDMGISQRNLELMARVAPHVVVGVPGTGIGGSRSTSVAGEGLFLAIKKAAELHGIPLEELKVALQGLGGVGNSLLTHLVAANVDVTAVDKSAVARASAHGEFGAKVTILNDPEAIYDVSAHVFSPCAVEDVLNAGTILRIARAGTKVVLGAANNALREETEDMQLREAGISYYPEFVVGIGGILGAVSNIFGFDPRREILEIPDLVERVHGFMQREDLTGLEAGRKLVLERRRRWSMERMFRPVERH